jgi:hypothetical protein
MNIRVDDGKICNFKIKTQIQFLKIKKLFVLSMWKLTLGYGILDCKTLNVS